MTKKNHQVSFPIDWDLALKKESFKNSYNVPLKNVFEELEQHKKLHPISVISLKLFNFANMNQLKW